MRRLLITLVACALGFPQLALATSNRELTIFDDASFTADANGTGFCLPEAADQLIFTLDAVHNSGTSTLDVKIQHAALGSSDWKDVSGVSFTQVTTADAFHTVNAAAGVFYLPCIRAVVDVGASGSPDYGATVKVHYRYTPTNR